MSSTMTGIDTDASETAAFQAILRQLATGEGTRLSGSADDDVQEHDLASIVVPRGMSMEHLEEVARKKAAELNKVHTFTHTTEYRPEDGAHAAALVIRNMFGLTVGKSTPQMFGPDVPPAYKTIKISANKSMEVPWGELFIPALEGASFEFGAVRSKRGPVFQVEASSPKKHRPKIEAFFDALDEMLKINSIYRGKAVQGAHELEFMRGVGSFKSDQIVFADHVQRTLNAAVFRLLDNPEESRRAGLPTKRTVLAFGPYGTGKTSLAMITAQRAEKAGWTFLSGRAGKDNLKDVMDTAILYQPAVVFIEDVDTHTPNSADKTAVSELLDVFDGVGSKDSELLVIMTTNHIEQVPAGMLRPGRLDYTVEIDGLDRLGTERLIRTVIDPSRLADDVDFDRVFGEMFTEVNGETKGWQPAWVKGAVDRVQAYALDEAGGELTFKITTQALVDAAVSLQPQLALMHKASEGYKRPELDEALDNAVQASARKVMAESALLDSSGIPIYKLGEHPEITARK